MKLSTSRPPTAPVLLHKQYETVINGRHVTVGTELTIQGVRGRCRFLAHTTNTRGDTWLDVADTRGALRAFTIDRVTTVHRTVKTRSNAQ